MPKAIKTKTVVLADDLSVTVDPEAPDDWEFMEMLEDNQFAKAMKHLIGDEQIQKLKNHYRDPKTGRVKVSVMSDALKTIMEKAAPNS